MNICGTVGSLKSVQIKSIEKHINFICYSYEYVPTYDSGQYGSFIGIQCYDLS